MIQSDSKLIEFEHEQPYAIVKVLPVCRSAVTELTPFIFYKNSVGEIEYSKEVLAWASASRISYHSTTINNAVLAVARFINFYRAVWTDEILSEGEFDYLVYAYLSTRLSGTVDKDGSCPYGLYWLPVKYKVIQQEFRFLFRYFQFSSKHFGHVNISENFKSKTSDNYYKRMAKLMDEKERDFFVHLKAYREGWKKIRGEEAEVPMPPVLHVKETRSSAVRQFPSTDEIVDLIYSTKNPVHRAMLIAAGFGGLRISEILNTYSVDILPHTYRPSFFTGLSPNGHQSRDILYLRAHPELSTYCGEMGNANENRTQYLNRKYGLLPRSALHKKESAYAGWKGTMPSGNRLVHEVFWIDASAASEFNRCYLEIMDFIRLYKVHERHPYLYVNVGDKSGRYLGDFIKMSNAEKIFIDACTRIGVEAHKHGRNWHGLRHHFKWYAKEILGLDNACIQIAMGHFSIESQDQYGRSASAIHVNLAQNATSQKKVLFR
ncbi:hypothetical protein [Terasakiella pusilla]|uniref:hypothetical protein n=1 Tax=Terasakiella pusilla TaxID=64973 RepID=UPI003AA85328